MGIHIKALWDMLKRVNYVKIGQGLAAFAKRNEGTLVYGLGALGLAAAAKKFDVPIGDACRAYNSKDKIIDWDEIKRMNNPKDAAIASMSKTALDSYSTHTQLEAINSIKDLVLNSADISDSTMAYAIRTLEKIAKKSYSSNVEAAVQKAIFEIGKKE